MSTSEPHQLPAFRLFYAFLPETSLLRQVRFQLLAASRALSEIGQEAVFYGALVAVASDPLQATLIAAAKAVPAATLGLVGGVVADELPRRVGLGLGYATQAAACVVIPLILGVDFGPLLLLVAMVSAINQFVDPNEKAVIPLVSAKAQIATAASILAIAGAIGGGAGMGFLAPILMKVASIRALLFACSVLLALAAVRVFSLPLQHEVRLGQALKRLRLARADIGFGAALRWLLGWPAVATMITAGVVVSVLNMAIGTFGPSYVASALGAPPENSVYVFAPGSLAALAGLIVGPRMIDWAGERSIAMAAVMVEAVALFSLAFIDQIAPFLAPIGPARAAHLFDQGPNDRIIAVSFISLFTGFAASISSLAVQTYLNRRVPAIHQGRTFGLQGMLANLVAIVPLIGLGAIAQVTSVKTILFWTPWVVAGVIYLLLILTSRMTGRERPRGREVLASFWHEPAADVVGPTGNGA
jgi:MFS family permease